MKKTLKKNRKRPVYLKIVTTIVIVAILGACAIQLQTAKPSHDPKVLASLFQAPTTTESSTITQTPPGIGKSVEAESPTQKPELTTTTIQIKPSTSTPPPSYSHQIPLTETSELLYISDGKLNRWDYVTGYSGVMVENVTDFYPSQDGKKIILLRPHKMTVNGIARFDLDLLDLKSKQTISLLSDIPRFHQISISPDGAWLAYTISNTDQKLYLFNIEQASLPQEIGICHQNGLVGCGEISWSFNSQEIVWSDSLGIWHTNLTQPSSLHIHSETVSMTDPKGIEINLAVQFKDLQWSPAGRYVLTKVVPFSSGISWYGIVDIATGRFIRIPDTYDQSQKESSVIWTTDGSLLIANIGGTPEHQNPFLKRWSVLATHDNLLIPHSEVELNPELLPYPIPTTTKSSSPCIAWITHTKFPPYLLHISSDDPLSHSSIFSFNLEEGELSRFLELSHSKDPILWSPDLNGALIIGPRSQIIYHNFSSGENLDLIPIFGAEAKNFHWLPPSPRT